MKPSESKMRSRLRHTISLRTPLDCRQSQALQTSCEMKRRLFPGFASIISLIVLMSCLLTDFLRYVMIVSIPDTINHQELERKLILKKNCAEVVNLKFKRLLPVNGYSFKSLFRFSFYVFLKSPNISGGPMGVYKSVFQRPKTS